MRIIPAVRSSEHRRPLSPVSRAAHVGRVGSLYTRVSAHVLGTSIFDKDQCFHDTNWSLNSVRQRVAGPQLRLFRNAFKIKGTPESVVKKSKLISARSRRLIGMASGRLSSPELGSSPCSANSQNLECSAIFSPDGQNSTPHKSSGFKSSKPRFPLEEFDPNSQDSGYGGCSGGRDSEEKPSAGFQFAEPLGVAPRRLSLESRCSPMKSPIRSSPQRKRLARPALFRSLSSGYESTDDGFNELIDMESLEDESSRLPNGLSSLICGDIVTDSEEKPMELESTTPEAGTRGCGRANFAGLRRSLSMQPERLDDEEELRGSPPSASKVRSCLFRSPNASSSTAKLGFQEARCASQENSPVFAVSRKFKRPEPPGERSPVLVKRSRKSSSYQDVSVAGGLVKRRQQQQQQHPRQQDSAMSSPPQMLQRSHSETEAHAHIKSAIHRSTTSDDLTGDFSKPCVLPLADGQHEDLKSISSETLSRLIRGDFSDSVGDFKIVDCRYPYEFEAGHIDGALNLYTKEMIESALLDPLKHTPAIEPDSERKRSILVFHCEFSWERGPNLSRFLRNVDRQRNEEHYPALHYPEIYLLHGGYQKFFKDQRELCSPQGYRPMRHPDHEADLRQFRSKSKSWQGEKTNRANVVTARANLKRLGF
ncbi:M-phase inducer phosphatase isoform X2 [Nasonia vitripennis]|uniref:protein-tyrosine-phosphatase n=1 Tax=Nasonia vitripennis TaxID=7425 RepID=A0A7M7LR92_NASVI|nr:M-phase inducer phosphatase isoform X2 [Nasonia vitripennis]